MADRCQLLLRGGLGYYYLISVLDDYSRMIVGWRVQTSMSSADIIEVVQDAVEFTGQPTAPVEPGPALLSDNGPGFLSSSPSEKHGWRVLGGIMGPVQ